MWLPVNCQGGEGGGRGEGGIARVHPAAGVPCVSAEAGTRQWPWELHDPRQPSVAECGQDRDDREREGERREGGQGRIRRGGSPLGGEAFF